MTTGATIATAEPRYVSYLNLLNGDDPFPDASEPTLTPTEVLNAAGGFIVGSKPCE